MTAQSFADRAVLKNGVEIPWLGLGVWKVEDGDTVARAVKTAIAAGYRSIDTAAIYKNESGVGQGIKESEVPREELFITSKVWNSDQGYDSTLKAFEESRKKLGLEYLDLYLIHWPVKGKYKETWKALEKLNKEGLVRAIGVSNFQIHHLEDVLADAEIAPQVNQVEFHPRLTQKALREYAKQQGIQLEAWSPLAQGGIGLFDEPVIVDLAKKYGKSPAQIVLRWDLQNGVVTIPKSVNEGRIRENADIFDFALTDDEISGISGLNQDKRLGPDPDNFDF